MLTVRNEKDHNKYYVDVCCLLMLLLMMVFANLNVRLLESHLIMPRGLLRNNNNKMSNKRNWTFPGVTLL